MILERKTITAKEFEEQHKKAVSLPKELQKKIIKDIILGSPFSLLSRVLKSKEKE